MLALRRLAGVRIALSPSSSSSSVAQLARQCSVRYSSSGWRGMTGGNNNNAAFFSEELMQSILHLRAALLDMMDKFASSGPRDDLFLEVAGLGLANNDSNSSEQQESSIQEQLSTLMDGIMLMGVPKSKVSPSRKRMKHLQHVPDPVNWYKCTRCGEAKRPHRICTAHMEICALSDEDYAARQAGGGASISNLGSTGNP